MADGVLASNQARTQTDWIVAWSKPDPFDVVFDFKTPHAIDRVRFFFTGQLPQVTLAGSTDGQKWEPLAVQATAEDAGRDVRDQTVSGPLGDPSLPKNGLRRPTHGQVADIGGVGDMGEMRSLGRPR